MATSLPDLRRERRSLQYWQYSRRTNTFYPRPRPLAIVDPRKIPGLVALYNISDLSTLFVERTGASASTPASVDGVIGTIIDLSGAGNHITAQSDAARPLLKLDGSTYYGLGDGTDDKLVGLWTPTSAMTLICKFRCTDLSLVRIPFGGGSSSGGRAYVGFDNNNNGMAGGGVGTHNTSTIRGTTTNLLNTDIVVTVTWNGSVVKLYLGQTEEYSGAQSGSPAAQAMGLFGWETNFFPGRVYKAMAFNRVLTDSERAKAIDWVMK